MKHKRGFTLVEMLVVIAIIGIVAAMVVNMAGKANQMKHKAAVDAEKTKLVHLINAYHDKLGFYPPDNPNVASNVGNFTLYEGYTASNPLLYELGGLTPSNNVMLTFDGSNFLNTVFSNDFLNCFARSSVNNGNPDEPHNFYAGGLSMNEYTNYPNLSVKGFIVPVGNVNNSVANFWHYDASSPNRHNQSSYDLWAEYPQGMVNGTPLIITNGNWQ